jgi:arabinogalactan endo-1,4-beta-galactosidase
VFGYKQIWGIFICSLCISCGDDKGTEINENLISSSEAILLLSSSSSFQEIYSSSLEPSFSSGSIEYLSSGDISTSSSMDELSSSYELLSSSSAIILSSSSNETERFSSSSDRILLSSSRELSSSSPIVYQKGDYILGADISKFQEYESRGVKFYDSDGIEKSIFDILKNHGFNYVRLKTFVSPSAAYGYAASGCGETSTESFGDKTHVIAYAQKVKSAGMGFSLDIHYSDNWADPSKQIIPERWRSVTTIEALADSVYAYTYDLVMALKNAGAMPDMVQIGNEITNGMLYSLPTGSTNCWGDNVQEASSAVSGKLSLYPSNLAKLLKAGVKAVNDVSASIQTVMHIESAVKNGSWWMSEVVTKQGVDFDIMAFSAYTAYGHGTPTDWSNFISTQMAKFPQFKYMIAEYNGASTSTSYTSGARAETNTKLKSLSGTLGSFYWEPALTGAWGTSMFTWSGNNLYADDSDFEEFDHILSSLGLQKH